MLPRLTPWAASLALGLAALAAPAPAAAQEFRFNAEPAVAIWLDQPQSDRFTPGLYLALRPGISLGRVASVQWSYSLLYTPAQEGFTKNGSAHSLTTGLRLRPLAALGPESRQLGGLFVDFNLGYVRTGDLDRFGFDAGLGYNIQAAPWFAIGPVVRYQQIVQPDRLPHKDPNDAQFLSLGLNLAFGPAHKEAVEPVCPDAPECPQQEAAVSPAPAPEPIAQGCADRDGDGVCDADDRCPDQYGPPATLGCPIDPCGGKPLVVLVQFPYDSAALPPPVQDDPQTMDPVLEAVAAAIAQEPSCRVCIVGHASEEGGTDYNLKLSRERAAAVKGYLSARGLEDKRMPITGMGERCQLVPETTRPLNRRVDFFRLDDGESCPTECAE